MRGGLGELRGIDPVAGSRLDGLPRRNRVGLAFGLDRIHGLVVDGRACGAVRRLVDENPVDRSGGLEPGGGVHNVT